MTNKIINQQSIADKLNIPVEVVEFCDRYNPMTFYSHMISVGFSVRQAKELTAFYEIVYQPVFDAIKYKHNIK